jgi:hypothetical protein
LGPWDAAVLNTSNGLAMVLGATKKWTWESEILQRKKQHACCIKYKQLERVGDGELQWQVESLKFIVYRLSQTNKNIGRPDQWTRNWCADYLLVA